MLVVDLREQRQIPPALALLKRQHPTTGVLLVASQLDPALMLEAMRAGVNECVTDPRAAAELQAAIKRLVGNLAPAARGRNLRLHRRQGRRRRDDGRRERRDGAGREPRLTRRC